LKDYRQYTMPTFLGRMKATCSLMTDELDGSSRLTARIHPRAASGRRSVAHTRPPSRIARIYPSREAQVSRRTTAVVAKKEEQPPTVQPVDLPVEQSRGWQRWAVTLFVVSLAIPWVFPIGSARMSVYRLILCATIIPCLALWASGRAGRIRLADLAIVLFSCWRAVSFFAVNGMPALQSVGITSLETLGAYFLARCYIRTADDFRSMATTLCIVIAAMLPFVLIETVTGSRLILHIFGTLLPTYPESGLEIRKGLARVQGPFDHPILFGVFCSSGFALAILVAGFRQNSFVRWGKGGIVAVAAALSLSAGPLLGIALQALLLGWKGLARVIGVRLLVILSFALWAAIQLASWAMNRSVVEMVIARLTFDPLSYWVRNIIFDYARMSMFNHPLFGTGLSQWDRPSWLPPSIDNMWFATAVMSGIPAVTFLGAAVFLALAPIALKQGLAERETEYRAAYLISVVNWCLVGTTVAYWDAAYVLVIFLLGSGLWILEDRAAAPNPVTTAAPRALHRLPAGASVELRPVRQRRI